LIQGEHAEFVDEVSRPAPAPGSVSGYRGSLTEAMRVDSSAATAAIGGLSVTGCLADFSVYIFHPYGGKKTGSIKYLTLVSSGLTQVYFLQV